MSKRKLSPYEIEKRDWAIYELDKFGLNEEGLLAIFRIGKTRLYAVIKEQKTKVENE